MLRPALVLLLLFTLLTGVLYPLAVTGAAQAVFPHQANGSLIKEGDVVVGSELIGQPFDDPKYFWSRPSATAPFAYNAAASSGSNWGPLNPALEKAVRERIAALGTKRPVPADLVTASGSGLDPHISPAAADAQLDRVAAVRQLPAEEVRKLVKQFTEGPDFGVLGDSRVNVLRLNLALDARQGAAAAPR